MSRPAPFLVSALALAAIGIHAPVRAQSASPLAGLLEDLPWRAVGPAIMGGRIDDFAVVESDPRIYYVATAAGGILKTVNHGTTFTPVFDKEVTGSIGDITVAPSNPDVVWVGTGEANNRQSSSWGNGVYRSTDAGKTWTHLGLANTHHIARIVVHPTNPDVAYVAAVGRLWGPSPDRGLYKTVDGGKTWELVLAIDENTGVTDVVMDPTNPDTLVAASYQRRRTPFGFAGGGPGSGLHKTTDGGKTWKRLTSGLPQKELGRIGLDIYRKNPKVLYATVESENSGSTQSPGGNGGLYRSDDGGETWERMSNTNPRPMYFSQVRIDPNDDQTIWVLGVSMYVSFDGGRTFRFEDTVQRVHADGHALWIDPKDSNHVLLGCDGGIQVSWDEGRTWDFINTFPLAQPYEVYFDFQKPYWIYGGLQDNGTWGAPSQSLMPGRGISNDEWINVGGGDGFHARVDPTNPRTIYVESQNGAVRRVDPLTGESQSIRPRPPAGETYRFDWNTPFEISPHNPKKILLGGNRLFISLDRGDTWRRTEDLTRNLDRSKLPIMGNLVTRQTLSGNDGEDGFGEIVAVAESPVKAGILWVGTDDGNLQVSQDDGQTWSNVAGRLPGVPSGTYVTRVVPSRYAAGRCYVTLDNHRNNDFTAYVLVTEDFGQTWKSISGGLPEGNTASVVREHPRAENLLFVGTERGLWVSVDRGKAWQRFGEPLPTVPVDDLQIHPRDNDLILATHGRGFYILDDIGALEAVARGEVSGTVSLAPPKPAVHYRYANRKATTGHKIYVAPNPPVGAPIQFFVRGEVPESGVQLEIRDASGKKVLRTLSASRASSGWNRVTWDLRLDSPAGAGAGGFGGGFGFGGAGRGQAGAAGGRAQAGAGAGRGQGGAAGRGQAGAGRGQAGGAGRGGQAGGAGRGGQAGGAGRGQGGGGRGFGGVRGPRVLPGVYQVRLQVGDDVQTRTISVDDDPRITLSDRQRKELFEAQVRLGESWQRASALRPRLESARRQLAAVEEKATGALKEEIVQTRTRVEALLAKVAPAAPQRRGGPGGGAGQPGAPGGAGQPEGESAEGQTRPLVAPNFAALQAQLAATLIGRASTAIQSLEGITEPVSKAQKDEARAVESEVRAAEAETNRLLGRGLSGLNSRLTAAKLAPVKIETEEEQD